MHIGIDIDGVLASFTQDYITRLNVLNNTYHKIEPSDVKEWNFERHYWTKEQVGRFWETTANGYQFWWMLPSIPENVRAVQRLIYSGKHRITLVSHRPIAAELATKDWVRDYLDTTPNVILTGKKGKICDALGIEAFFDDKPENLEDIMKHNGLGCKPFLIDAPYNSNYADRQVTRVPNIQSGIDILMKGRL